MLKLKDTAEKKSQKIKSKFCKSENVLIFSLEQNEDQYIVYELVCTSSKP